MEKNYYIIIIWEKARHLEDEILKRISKQFKILKKFAIKWDEEKFQDNIYAFGGGCLVNSNFHEHHKGKGEFLVILIEDENEVPEERQTAQGIMLVNKNVFDFKYKTRAELLNNMCSLHVSNNMKETRHDFALLTGQSLKDFISHNELDGGIIYLNQNLPCVDGWKNLAYVFYILNETVNYAVMKSFDKLPDIILDNDDIDILVDDLQNFIAVLTASKLRDGVFNTHITLKLSDTDALFHAHFLGDDSLDYNFQKDFIKTRVLNEKGIYVPSKENLFYSLLYVMLYSKNYIKEEHLGTIKKLAKNLNINIELNNTNLNLLLNDFLKSKKYLIPESVYIPLYGEHNVLDKGLITREPKFYIVKKKGMICIFNKKLIGLDAFLVNRFFFLDEEERLSGFVNWVDELVELDNPKLKNYRKYLDEDTLFITFKRRVGKVLVTKLYEHKNKKIIKKFCIGVFQPKKIKTKYLVINFTEKRVCIPGKTVNDYLLTADKKEQRKLLDIFIGTVFKKFAASKQGKLKAKAFDMTGDNSLMPEYGHFVFFDDEFNLREEMDVGYLLWRIIQYAPLKEDKREIYAQYCRRLLIPEQYEYWLMKEQQVYEGIKNPPSSNIPAILSCLIPIKKYRRKFRDKYKGFDYHYVKRIFGKENI